MPGIEQIQISLETVRIGCKQLRALTTGTSNITEITLSVPLNDKLRQGLQSLTSLTRIQLEDRYIDGKEVFTGETLQSQPRLGSLTLLNCNDITEAGSCRIFNAFPAVQSIRYMTSPHAGCKATDEQFLQKHDKCTTETKLSLLRRARMSLSHCQLQQKIDITALYTISTLDVQLIFPVLRCSNLLVKRKPKLQ